MPSTPDIPPRKTRRNVVVIVLSIVALAAVAALADTGLAARSEYRLSTALTASKRVTFDPEVTLGGFPFVRHANRGEFTSLTITARGVALPRSSSPSCGVTQCWAELGVSATDVDAGRGGWALGSTSILRLGSAKAYTKLDSVNLGRMLDITDLAVNTPAPEDRAGGGGPGDGLLERTSGVMLTGTVPTSGADTARVSVTVDLSVVGSSLAIKATGFYTGPEEHSKSTVPPELKAGVLARFTRVVPLPALPWAFTPTSANSAGSDVLVTGDATPHVRVRIDDF